MRKEKIELKPCGNSLVVTGQSEVKISVLYVITKYIKVFR